MYGGFCPGRLAAALSPPKHPTPKDPTPKHPTPNAQEQTSEFEPTLYTKDIDLDATIKIMYGHFCPGRLAAALSPPKHPTPKP